MTINSAPSVNNVALYASAGNTFLVTIDGYEKPASVFMTSNGELASPATRFKCCITGDWLSVNRDENTIYNIIDADGGFIGESTRASAHGNYYREVYNSSGSYIGHTHSDNIGYAADLADELPLLRSELHYCQETGNRYIDPDFLQCWPVRGYHSSYQPSEPVFCSSDTEITIGFEVEFNRFYDQPINGVVPLEICTDPLFARVERDGSCGLEAITHYFPVNSDAVTESINNNSDWIDDCDADSQCGGHISFRIASFSSSVTAHRFTDSCLALVMSIWRKRLRNSYVFENVRSAGIKATIERDDPDARYVPVGLKGNGIIECRVPGAVRNAHNLLARYNLFSFFAKCCELGLSHSEVMQRQELPFLVLDIYRGDTEKANRALNDAGSYQDYIETNMSNPDIEEYIYN